MQVYTNKYTHIILYYILFDALFIQGTESLHCDEGKYSRPDKHQQTKHTRNTPKMGGPTNQVIYRMGWDQFKLGGWGGVLRIFSVHSDHAGFVLHAVFCIRETDNTEQPAKLDIYR